MPEPTDEELGLDPAQMEGLDPNIRAEIRKNRSLTKEVHDLQLAKAVAERDAAFVRAGIPDNPLGQLFAKGYDGDPNDPAAIKAAYDALGVQSPAPTPDPPVDQPTDQELDAQRRIASAGAAGDNDGSIKFEDAVGAATTVADVMALLESAPPSAVDFAGRRVVPPIID